MNVTIAEHSLVQQRPMAFSPSKKVHNQSTSLLSSSFVEGPRLD